MHCETSLKMGWVVKKYIFSFLTSLNWSKCILMVSLYIWLSIFTNNETLLIILKFDLSSSKVLGRIYALSIAVRCDHSFLWMSGQVSCVWQTTLVTMIFSLFYPSLTSVCPKRYSAQCLTLLYVKVKSEIKRKQEWRKYRQQKCWFSDTLYLSRPFTRVN